jgi:hypothetical protein
LEPAALQDHLHDLLCELGEEQRLSVEQLQNWTQRMRARHCEFGFKIPDGEDAEIAFNNAVQLMEGADPATVARGGRIPLKVGDPLDGKHPFCFTVTCGDWALAIRKHLLSSATVQNPFLMLDGNYKLCGDHCLVQVSFCDLD